MPHCIVTLDGFKTIVFPAIRDGAANLNACQYGKFHGIRLAMRKHFLPKDLHLSLLETLQTVLDVMKR